MSSTCPERENATPLPRRSSPPSLVGQNVGRIRVQGFLDRGGMGEVYVGFDETLRRQVALKAMHAHHRLAPEARARFIREARILSQLEHPNICKIHDFIESDDAEGTPQPASDHPDDFHTRHGELVGTPIYMSPEQARGEPVTTASDMYSYGLVLQTLFAGTRPHPKGLSSRQVLVRAREGRTSPVSGIDSDLAGLIKRLKSIAPAARPTAVAALERLRWIRAKPKRRLRRLVAAAVIAAVTLGAAKYTFDLKTARDAANLRREQAEGLIGFMIGDLRGKLAPVNRLEVLDDIGDKALEYFAAVPAAELSGEELLFRSQTLSQIGQVRMDQGNLPAAAEAFGKAERLARGLVERAPGNVAWRAELGAAYFWAGSVDWMQRDLDGALASFRRYLDESRELARREPDNLDWQLELSYAHSNVGSVLEAQGNIPGAIDEFQTSLEITRQLAEAKPGNAEWRSELAGSHSWLGEALLSQGELEQALGHYTANRDLLEALVREDPANRRYRWPIRPTARWSRRSWRSPSSGSAGRRTRAEC